MFTDTTVHSYVLQNNLKEDHIITTPIGFGTIIRQNNLYKIKWKSDKVKIHSTFTEFLNYHRLTLSELKFTTKIPLTNITHSVKQKPPSYYKYQAERRVRKEKVQINQKLTKPILEEILKKRKIAFKLIKYNTEIKDKNTGDVLFLLLKNVIPKSIFTVLKKSTMALPFVKRNKDGKTTSTIKKFIAGTISNYASFLFKSNDTFKPFIKRWIKLNSKYFTLVSNLLKINSRKIYDKINSLNIEDKFGIYPSVAINYGNVKGLHKDIKDLSDGLSILCYFGQKRKGGLELNEFKRVARIEEGDVIMFNGRKMWHNVEQIRGFRWSVILYCHDCYFKYPFYNMRKGEAEKKYKKEFETNK
ncbi:hypothetical protein ABK040_012186 [Willaertia magna]